MSDMVKISALPISTTISTGDYIPVVEGGVTKRVQAGPGGGLDVDTVSGYGIGVETATVWNSDLNGLVKGGTYWVGYGAGFNFPSGVVSASIVTVHPLNADNTVQMLFSRETANKVFVRRKISASWGPWRDMFDADTVSGYGVGVNPTFTNVDFDTLTKGGIYYNYGANAPGGFTTKACGCLVIAGDNANYVTQIGFYMEDTAQRNRVWIRNRQGTWSAWYEIFNALTDGNGGQPPAGKALISVQSRTQNQYVTFTMSYAAAYLIQAHNATPAETVSCVVFTTSGGGILFSYIAGNKAATTITSNGMDVRITNLGAATSDMYYAITRI